MTPGTWLADFGMPSLLSKLLTFLSCFLLFRDELCIPQDASREPPRAFASRWQHGYDFCSQIEIKKQIRSTTGRRTDVKNYAVFETNKSSATYLASTHEWRMV
jgi:hypothetical protein